MKNPSKALQAHEDMSIPIDWDSVYQSELPRVYNYFLYKAGSREFAQDLTATTFERAWRLRSRYQKGIASLPTWLFGIARNVLKEHVRGNRRDERRSVPLSEDDRLPSGVDVESKYQQQQDKELLSRKMRELSPRQQDLIALKYGAGLTNREIGKLTRLSESNVGTILHRAVKQLRREMEDEDGR